MSGKKRQRNDVDPSQKPKKIKFTNDDELNVASKPVQDEIDFPRGGGSSFTPLEYKNIRAEAIKEANAELVFEDSQVAKKTKTKLQRRESGTNFVKKRKAGEGEKKNGENIRVEHLNYKRLIEGMKIFGQIIAIQPLALIVSLPCQLVGHVPITHVSTQLTKQLEALDEEDEEFLEQDDDETRPRRAPELFEIFRVGQYVRAVVTAIRPAGTTSRDIIGLRRKMDEIERACQRVELSLIPERVNIGVSKEDLSTDFILSAAVQTVEDHGYILDLGVPSVTGFLSFKDAKKSPYPDKLSVGYVLDTCVSQMSENGRTCTVTIDTKRLTSSSLSHISSVTSVLPGTLALALVTAVVPSGLNVQLLGYFEGTIDVFHLPFEDIASRYKVGQKIKARVLWEMTTAEPRKFALSLLPHIIDQDTPRLEDKQPVHEAFPIGTTLEDVKIIRVEAERGLVVKVQDNVQGYVHIRHVSDDHVPSLSPNSGHWKIGTIHRARVVGFQALDGILQLSLQSSVLEQKFLQVGDVEVGERLKATVKKLTSTGLFVSISGNVDGVIWPNHYADITLKQPQKRFKEGSTLKCRVLVVDPDRRRIALTAKKTLVESDLPIISRLEDAQMGIVTHAVVYKIVDKGVLVEFYNNLRAQVSVKEASETPLANLAEAFPIGKPVKVRILNVDHESGRMTASIRQVSSKVATVPDVHGVQVGETVQGPIEAIHKDHAVVTLEPTGIVALLSLNNLANNRNTTAAQLRTTLIVGERMNDLIVLSQNPDKGIVIVSKRPKSRTKPETLSANEGLSVKSVQVGQMISARVTGYGRGGSALHITNSLKGTLHPTDACDDYCNGTPFPNLDTVIQGVITSVDKPRRQVILSTRPSRLRPSETKIPRDREISSIEDLHVGESIRGFVKSIAEHGLFVSLGRTIDARVQIKELFDGYVKDWKPRFEINQLVQGKIVRVNAEAGQVEMSLRSGPVEMTLRNYHEGQKVDAIIKKKENYGIFIQIKDTKISGLCHRSQISDNTNADIDQVVLGFREGDPVKVVILTINLEKGRISFGLKPSYFSDEDFETHEPETSAPQDNQEAVETADDPGPSDGEEEDTAIMDNGANEMELLPPPQEQSVLEAIPALKLQGGFGWSNQAMEPDDQALLSPSVSDHESNAGQSKTSKKRKKAIEYDLTADMHTRQPESTADFERLLLGSPNSSYLWIQYMSFQLQLSEIDKAKEVGKRALRTINFREEAEKLNIWIALLNLENKYGTDESLEVVFRDAARHNDSKTIHLRMASIFDETDRHDRATEQYQRTCKKFGKSSKAWTLFGEYYLKCGEMQKARELLPRCLQSLEKRKHLKTITKFAQMEYKRGDPERGRTLFEGIVDSHPKRWDLWSVYMDMEVTQKNLQGLRSLFGRVLALKMTSHKAKAFFKKWLELEKQLGDKEGEEIVKEKALEWTRLAGAGAS
ncbi:U3 snoRNP-associated protein Rrp5 [Ramaria rubella]|nr:U3 snoRNP-associated protein Rrp5 [Ramaria rubella]